MSALSALPPPPSDCYTKETSFCVCGARRGRQAAKECEGVWLGRIAARRTLYHTFVLVCGGGLTEGAGQNGGEFLAISGKLHWIPKPATLVAPKSGPHPSQRYVSGNSGQTLSETGYSCLAAAKCPNCWIRRRPDLWIDRMAGDGSIPAQGVFSTAERANRRSRQNGDSPIDRPHLTRRNLGCTLANSRFGRALACVFQITWEI